MKKLITHIFAIIIIISVNIQKISAQENPADSNFVWYHFDNQSTDYAGISLNKAYDFAMQKGLKSKEIIVAVIDSGIDTSHVDLKDNLWVNPSEIAYNRIDDDHNGYIDDIHGWDFPANANGYCVEGETLELTRLYRQYKKEFNDKSASEIPADKKEAYKEWLIVKKDFEQQRKLAVSNYAALSSGLKYYDKCVQKLAEYFENANFTKEDVKNIRSGSESLLNARSFYLKPFGKDMSREDIVSSLSYWDDEANKRLNVLYDPRAKVGDDVTNINDSLIGNNNLYPEGSNHGTGVSGIIAAVRNNGVGFDGIATNVKIMLIRVVPGGDEYDKDVALAIRYAVKMGARIINCSFGKDYSPNKEFVDNAVRFAAANDVLIIHASGNDAKNIDKFPNFPTKYLKSPEETAWNWIEVGASNMHANHSLAADFSNYGKEVDIFAPGVDIYSTKVKSKFGTSSGTSDAAPVVTGIATLVLSYFPNLTAAQLKSIVLDSGTDYRKMKVLQPSESGKRKKTRFSKLSSTGKVVNAYTALKLAFELNG